MADDGMLVDVRHELREVIRSVNRLNALLGRNRDQLLPRNWAYILVGLEQITEKLSNVLVMAEPE